MTRRARDGDLPLPWEDVEDEDYVGLLRNVGFVRYMRLRRHDRFFNTICPSRTTHSDGRAHSAQLPAVARARRKGDAACQLLSVSLYPTLIQLHTIALGFEDAHVWQRAVVLVEVEAVPARPAGCERADTWSQQTTSLQPLLHRTRPQTRQGTRSRRGRLKR